MSETMSMVSSKSGKKGIDKHCTVAECNGLKISAPHWAKHAKKHGDHVVQPNKCTGAECKICADHESKILCMFFKSTPVAF